MIVKIIAATTGPTGVGLFSLLRQTQQTAVLAATFAGTTALIQGVASREGPKKENYVVTVAWIFLGGAFLTLIVFVVFASFFADWIFNQDDARSIAMFRSLTVPIMLMVASTYFMGMLNVYRALGKIAVAQAAAASSGLLAVYPLSQSGDPMAWVVLLGVMAAGWALASGGFAVQEGWLRLFRQGSSQREAFRYFFSIAGVMLVTSFLGSATVLVVRAMCAHAGGVSESGIFDAAWTLSMMYLLLLLNSFGTYYLPVLSSLPDAASRAALIRRVLRVCILLAVPLITSVIVLKPIVIHIFYSSDFTPALKIMRWMLIGDYFKVTSWVFALPMLAFADMRRFLWSEVGGNALLVTGAAWSILQESQVEGVGISFAASYALYLFYTASYCKTVHGVGADRQMWFTWLLGLLVILGASLTHWNRVTVDVVFGMGWIILSLVVVLYGLRKDERSKITTLILSRMKHE